MSTIDINVVKPTREVDIVVEPNLITVNVTVSNGGGGGGAVDSVNGQTGVVVLDADDIATTATKVYVTPSEKTAITHSNRTILDAINEAFTTTLKSTYDGVASSLATLLGTGSRLITSAEITKLSNTSGTNTGDETTSTIQTKRPLKTVASQSLEGSGNVALSKSDVGLGNVDNTSDANKPISTATQTALNLKADLTNTPRILKSIFTGNAVTTTETVVGTCQVGGIGLGSSFSLKCFLRSQKSNNTSVGNLKIYINSTPDLSGSPVQLAINNATSALLISLERTFIYSGGNLYGLNSTSVAVTDIANSTVAETVTVVDMTTTRYIVATLQTSGTAGSTLNGRDFKVIVEPNVT